MIFSPRVELIAGDRQSQMDGYGSWCAMCGKGLWYIFPKSVPILPISKGGNKKAENSILICDKCFSELDSPGKTEIPMKDIPYYDRAPSDWYLRSRQKTI